MKMRLTLFASSVFVLAFFALTLFPIITQAQDFGDTIGDTFTPPDTGGTTTGSVTEQYEDIQRQGLIFANICTGPSTPCECRDEGRCTLEDILQVVANLSVFILGITGSLVLIMFIYGGFTWLTAAGSPERVAHGKRIFVGAVIGLVIIFGSYTAITLLISVLKTGTVPESGENLEDVIGGEADAIINTQNQ